MLEQLYIKNVALIDEALIEFNKGLNILSGETGAGKSIIIGSITFVLGGRATKDFIQKDCEQAKVEALLSLNSSEVLNNILEMTQQGLGLCPSSNMPSSMRHSLI